MGYVKIDFWKFALGAGIVALAAIPLQNADRRLAWSYVAVILLGFLLFNRAGVTAWTSFLQRELGSGGK